MISRRAAVSVVRRWLVALLGAYSGAGLSFMLTALRRDARGKGYFTDYTDDLALWLLFTMATVAATVVASAATRLDHRTCALYALAGGLVAAALPSNYRSPGELTHLTLGALLASPLVVMAIVLAINQLGVKPTDSG